MDYQAILEHIRGGLIVSVQPDANQPQLDPLNDAAIMAALAQAVVLGGAVAIRADSPAHIHAIREKVQLPLIGLYKFDIEGFDVRITPTLEHARAVAHAGADIIAVDGTARPRPEGLSAPEFIQRVKAETDALVMADIATFVEGLAAAEAGADFIATTLSGYTADSHQSSQPDYRLVRSLHQATDVPIIAEGRIATPQHASRMLSEGAFAITVGSAITRPRSITERFIQEIKGE
jgi:N-acylglucosamine-6-phosphate 2-epimerase